MRSRPLSLVFDLDGTLIDSAPDLHAAVNQLLVSEGRRNLELREVVGMIGDGVPTLVRRAYEATGALPDDMEGRVRQYHALYGAAMTQRTVPYPGVARTLAALAEAEHRLAVCTNKPQAAAVTILEALGLAGFFAAIVGGDTLPVRKPDAGHLLGTLRLLRAEPDAAVMIGDSRNDVAVARNAGVRAIAVSYGYSDLAATDLGADLVVDTFAAIPDALEGLARMERPAGRPAS